MDHFLKCHTCSLNISAKNKVANLLVVHEVNENSSITLPFRYARREDATEGLTTALEVNFQHVAIELELVYSRSFLVATIL